MALQQKMDHESIRTAPWYQKESPAEVVPIPALGPDIVDLRQLDIIRAHAGTVPEQTEALAEEQEG